MKMSKQIDKVYGLFFDVGEASVNKSKMKEALMETHLVNKSCCAESVRKSAIK